MDVTQTLRGVLVSVVVEPYDFTNKTGERVQGISRKAFFVSSAHAEPEMLRFDEAMDGELRRLISPGPGVDQWCVPVEVRVRVRPAGYKWRLDLLEVQPLGKAAAA